MKRSQDWCKTWGQLEVALPDVVILWKSVHLNDRTTGNILFIIHMDLGEDHESEINRPKPVQTPRRIFVYKIGTHDARIVEVGQRTYSWYTKITYNWNVSPLQPGSVFKITWRQVKASVGDSSSWSYWSGQTKNSINSHYYFTQTSWRTHESGGKHTPLRDQVMNVEVVELSDHKLMLNMRNLRVEKE